MKTITTAIGILLFITILAACSGSDTSATTTSTGLYCTATYEGSSTASTSIPVLIEAAGGTAPYNLAAFTVAGVNSSSNSGTTSFSGSTSITGYFPSDPAVGSTGTVTISDSAGGSASCYFTVGSTSTTTSSTSNGCSIYASTATPYLNQATTFTVQNVSGWGVAPYTFYSFSAGSGSTSGLQQTSTTSAYATVTFPVAGTQTIYSYIRDANGNVGTCSTAVTVSSTYTTGTTGTDSCIVAFGQNPGYPGNYISVTGTSTLGVPLTLQSVWGPTNMGITGYIVNSSTAELNFPQAGSYPITLYMTDAYGQSINCVGTETIY